MSNATCTVAECDRASHARTFCTLHYQRFKKTGNPLALLRAVRPDECTIEDCNRPVHGRGLCGAHWMRDKRHGDPLGGGDDRQPQKDSCTIDGCEGKPVGRNLCSTHWLPESPLIRGGIATSTGRIRGMTSEHPTPAPTAVREANGGGTWPRDER